MVGCADAVEIRADPDVLGAHQPHHVVDMSYHVAEIGEHRRVRPGVGDEELVGAWIGLLEAAVSEMTGLGTVHRHRVFVRRGMNGLQKRQEQTV